MSPLLNSTQLFQQLRAAFPGGKLGNKRYFQILPFLPYIVLPGGKRRAYDLDIVLAFLRSHVRLDEASDQRVIHRTRPRRRQQSTDLPETA